MSTADLNNLKKPVVPAVGHIGQFAHALMAEFNCIPNNCLRVIGYCTPGERITPPSNPTSVRGYYINQKINTDAHIYKKAEAEGKTIIVWDIPKTVWDRRFEVPMPWAEFFRGTVKGVNPNQKPGETNPNLNHSQFISERLSPYEHCEWFKPKLHVSDPKMLAIREIFPRAYEAWGHEEKTETTRRLNQGEDYVHISKDLHRQPEAVTAIIWKHYPSIAKARGLPVSGLRGVSVGPDVPLYASLPPLVGNAPLVLVDDGSGEKLFSPDRPLPVEEVPVPVVSAIPELRSSEQRTATEPVPTTAPASKASVDQHERSAAPIPASPAPTPVATAAEESPARAQPAVQSRLTQTGILTEALALRQSLKAKGLSPSQIYAVTNIVNQSYKR